MSNLNTRDVLREKGFRVTPGRVRVLDLLAKKKRPFTVAEMRKRMGSEAIDQVTLYRTLEAFVARGIARRVELQRGRARSYELSGEHHHHLVCTGCGLVESFSARACESAARTALKRARRFAAVHDHAFELFGLCNGCARSSVA